MDYRQKRRGRNWTDRVPAIVEAIRALPVTSATLDGEGAVIDERGVTDLERLRSALAGRDGSRAAFLYALRCAQRAISGIVEPRCAAMG